MSLSCANDELLDELIRQSVVTANLLRKLSGDCEFITSTSEKGHINIAIESMRQINSMAAGEVELRLDLAKNRDS